MCYRRRNQWLRLALALFCLPLIWLARVVYLLVVVAEGRGGWRGHAYPCAVTGHVMLRYSVGVEFYLGCVLGCGCGWWFGGGWTWIVAFCRWYQCGIKVRLCAGRVGTMPLLVLRHGGQGVQGVKRGLGDYKGCNSKLCLLPCCAKRGRRGVCVCARMMFNGRVGTQCLLLVGVGFAFEG